MATKYTITTTDGATDTRARKEDAIKLADRLHAADGTIGITVTTAAGTTVHTIAPAAPAGPVPVVAPDEKQCATCDNILPIAKFLITGIKKDGTRGRGTECRTCREARYADGGSRRAVAARTSRTGVVTATTGSRTFTARNAEGKVIGTRTSKTRIYTHCVYVTGGAGLPAGSIGVWRWSGSQAAAARYVKELRGKGITAVWLPVS